MLIMHRFPKCYAMTRLSQSRRTLLQYFMASIIVNGRYGMKITLFRDISRLICWRWWHWTSFIDWNTMLYKNVVEYFRKCGHQKHDQSLSAIIAMRLNQWTSSSIRLPLSSSAQTIFVSVYEIMLKTGINPGILSELCLVDLPHAAPECFLEVKHQC